MHAQRSVARFCGPLAQLVEQLTLNQRVPGSSPGRLTTFSPITYLFRLFRLF
jgi:hypothetical protein